MNENDVWKNTLVVPGDMDSIVSAFKLALYQDLLKSYVLAASAWNWIEKEFVPADPDPYGKMLDAMRASIRAYLDEHRDALEKITAYEPNYQTRWLVAANEVRAQNLGFCFGSVIQPDVLCDLKNNSAFAYEVTGEWPARKNEP